jgi:anaerobic selenocysteine-containing dehydrogenase
MDRRSFIKLTAVTGTSAGLAACGNPEHAVIRFVPPEDITPGTAEWKPSVCPICQAGCGVQARVMAADVETVKDGQAGIVRRGVVKKLEGNPSHPTSQGGLCARGQAAVQITFHPDRLRSPLKRTGARGAAEFQPISWDDAIAELVGKLNELEASGAQAKLACFTRDVPSHRAALLAEFLGRFGAPPAIAYEAFGADVLRRANELSFGIAQRPTVDLADSRYLISFGADFLGTWNAPVPQNAGYGRMRTGVPGVRGKFVQVERRMSQTGANADEWIPVTPGTEGVLALGLAHVIMAAGLRPASAAGRAGTVIEGWAAGLPAYTPEAVASRTGVAADRIDRLAREFAANAPAVAIAGGAPLAQTNGLFHAVAANALTALVGSVGVAGGLAFTPRVPAAPGFSAPRSTGPAARTLATLAANLLASPGGDQAPVRLLLVDGANPVHAAPKAWRLGDALDKVPYIASFSSFLDETSVLADLILPDHSFLESWTDALPESGSTGAVASVGPPTMLPLYETRATPDVLLDISTRLAAPIAPAFPWKTFDELLQAAYGRLPGDSAWSDAQTNGGWWGELPRPRGAERASAAATEVAYTDPQFDGADSDYPFHFLPYPSTLLDGSVAHLPWLQELPDPLTSAMWGSWVEVNPQTAARLNIAQGDMVEVSSRQGAIRAPAVLSPGIAPDAVAVPAGQGHTNFTRYASLRGTNPLAILAPMAEASTGALAWAATRVQLARVSAPDGTLIQFAGMLKEENEDHHR